MSAAGPSILGFELPIYLNSLSVNVCPLSLCNKFVTKTITSCFFKQIS